jgi:hypothetical protein
MNRIMGGRSGKAQGSGEKGYYTSISMVQKIEQTDAAYLM